MQMHVNILFLQATSSVRRTKKPAMSECCNRQIARESFFSCKIAEKCD